MCCFCISGSRQLDRGLLSWSSLGRRGRGSLCRLGSALASAAALLACAALAGRSLRSLLGGLWRRGEGSRRRLRRRWRCGRLGWRCRAGGLASAAAARSCSVRGSRARALAAARLRRRHIIADAAEVSGAAARQLRLRVSRCSLNLALRAPGRLCSRCLSGKASRLCLQGRDRGRIELEQICSNFRMICANNNTDLLLRTARLLTCASRPIPSNNKLAHSMEDNMLSVQPLTLTWLQGWSYCDNVQSWRDLR